VLRNSLSLDAKSPAIHTGIDPAALANLPQTIITDLKKYIYTDINGTARPLGGNPDLGAYERVPLR
jgi:hypothetical protein